MIDGAWLSSNKFDPRAVAIYERHYSARRYADGRKRTQFVGPGECMVLLTQSCDALFVWVRNRMERYDKQEGVNCAVFRNESSMLSSDLIREADELAWQRWPGERHFTYVEDGKIRSSNPGFCFLKAGWQRVGRNKTGRLTLLERTNCG
jgi:hypothetical protein